MANFQWLNLTQIGPANTSGGTSIDDITSSAVSNVLNQGIYGSNGLESLVVFGTVDVNTPSAEVMASATDIVDGDPGLVFESVAHGFKLGLKVQFTTSNTLPTGISLATDYFVIVVDADSFMVATSLANALAGTAVDYTNTGTGNQTATPVALAGCTGKLQGSFDETNWADVPNASETITADGSFVVEVDYARYAAWRWKTDLTAGMVTYSTLQIGYRGGN